MKCANSKGPLSAAEREAIAAAKPIEELIPRATPQAQKDLLEKIINGDGNDTIDDSVEDELNVV
jgi:hypothetical protein